MGVNSKHTQESFSNGKINQKATNEKKIIELCDVNEITTLKKLKYLSLLAFQREKNIEQHKQSMMCEMLCGNFLCNVVA
ncbi:CLUMA_CG006746, isoform A [Clunio marinus]|uniref:CLUMA_CG006746, isoform A n=1 Tax=Clunio marinus TaxID=568069 RepID=A0A1J1I088_9DIPT|nr:CLUMA_CG006746, isoform A [Clunio marinus]